MKTEKKIRRKRHQTRSSRGPMVTSGTLTIMKGAFVTIPPLERVCSSNWCLKTSMEATSTPTAGNRFLLNGKQTEKAFERSLVQTLGWWSFKRWPWIKISSRRIRMLLFGWSKSVKILCVKIISPLIRRKARLNRSNVLSLSGQLLPEIPFTRLVARL